MTMDEYLEIIVRVKGVKAQNKMLPPGAGMAGVPEDLLEEMSDNANYFAEFGYEGRDDPSLVHPKDVSLDGVPQGALKLTVIAWC
jgi:hypothetical protein